MNKRRRAEALEALTILKVSIWAGSTGQAFFNNEISYHQVYQLPDSERLFFHEPAKYPQQANTIFCLGVIAYQTVESLAQQGWNRASNI